MSITGKLPLLVPNRRNLTCSSSLLESSGWNTLSMLGHYQQVRHFQQKARERSGLNSICTESQETGNVGSISRSARSGTAA